MSDQEKESGLTTPVVVVDQTEGGPIKPFHTANPQNNPEHQTRSKAPSLPSIPGDLVKTKSGGTASFINQNKPKVENKSAPPPVPEKQIPTPAPPVPEKQIPTPTKRPSIVDEGNREHLNSIVTLATLQVDSKRSNLSSPQQPIPPSTFPDESVTKDDKQDEDSMNDVVPELPPQKRYDWETPSFNAPKKEITWDGPDAGQKKMYYRTKSQPILLERKASVGPYRSRTALEPASGISFCVPKRSLLTPDWSESGINILISKKTVGTRSSCDNQPPEKRAIKVDPEIPCGKIFGAMRVKYDIARSRVRAVFKF